MRRIAQRVRLDLNADGWICQRGTDYVGGLWQQELGYLTNPGSVQLPSERLNQSTQGHRKPHPSKSADLMFNGIVHCAGIDCDMFCVKVYNDFSYKNAYKMSILTYCTAYRVEGSIR